jgi:hypothetical protein
MHRVGSGALRASVLAQAVYGRLTPSFHTASTQSGPLTGQNPASMTYGRTIAWPAVAAVPDE